MMYLLISGISHLVNTYLSYRYFEYFFGGEKYNSIVIFVSFALYFLFDAYIYSHYGGIAFMLISNVVLFYLLSRNYRGKQRKKMFAALFYGLIFSALELGVLFFVLHFPLELWEEDEYSYIWGMFFPRFCYLFLLPLWKIAKITTNRYLYRPIVG